MPQGTKTTLIQKQIYWDERGVGATQKEAAFKAGIGESTALLLERQRKSRLPTDENGRLKRQADPLVFSELGREARRALKDFAYFQRRYFGRVSYPWQVEAAESIVEWLESDHKEYAVVNAPPGVGKTTLFTLDIPAWLTARNRQIRGMMGSSTTGLAQRYTNRLRRHLGRTLPLKAKSDDLAAGLAFDAETTMAHDFGRFQSIGDMWTADAFVVQQYEDMGLISEKEPTWSAYGQDAAFIGGRFDFVIWDDLVDPKKQKTEEAKKALEDYWDDVSEPRLEPHGLLILQGQRFASDDLYRYCLNKIVGEEIDYETGEEIEGGEPMYHHIKYKAHYTDRCNPIVTHKKGAPGWPEGCLLSPERLPWRELSAKIANRADHFEVVYQQEDTDPANVLVPKAWVYGHDNFPGCTDEYRDRLELPKGPDGHCSLSGELLSVITADPSPTKFWCVAGDSLVQTAWGDKPIADLNIGDRVQTRAGLRKVLRRQYMGEKETVALRLSNGRTLRLTPDHLLAVPGGWIAAANLLPGTLLCTTGSPVVDATGSTVALPFGDDEVVTLEGVTPLAMGLSDLGSDVGRARHVGPVVGVQQVSRVATRGVRAEVLDLVGDLVFDQHAVGQAVGHALSVAAVGPTNYPIPASITGQVPFPATLLSDSDPRAEVRLVDGDLHRLGDGPIPTDDTYLGSVVLDGVPAGTLVHVVSISPGATEPVYDIEVEGEHEFSVEGIIAHNCIMWWIYQPATEFRWLMDLERRPMEADEFLDFNYAQQRFTGVLEEWVETAAAVGQPVTHVIVEQNAAQRFLLQYDHVRRWMALHGIEIMGHDTHRNKSDPEFGVETIRQHYKFGRVRLPFKRGSQGFFASMKLIDEVTTYPKSRTDDCIMAHWFLEWNLPRIYSPTDATGRSWRPSWASTVPDLKRRPGVESGAAAMMARAGGMR